MVRIAKGVAAVASGPIDISCGGIVIRSSMPTARQLVRARGEGRRTAIMLVEAAGDIAVEPGTPIFSLDSLDPQLVVRELDGRAARGYFRAGRFIEVL
ncbi:hypothetical protein GTP81_02880 [Rugamonas sp. FT107W]|uniref:Uncharacterized protein n=1 Tax=Duganella vulcania TaxID=2692166 RepID=A0A845HDR1_9BURK|nr:hypothetical protein [Duganella vulcania]MYN15689.1 hypothetical protein [Duganella vulcania]